MVLHAVPHVSLEGKILIMENVQVKIMYYIYEFISTSSPEVHMTTNEQIFKDINL